MPDYSNRRRLAGRGLIAAALIAMPLTASISYAEPTAPEPPLPPAPPTAPAAPTPPAPPAAPLAPEASAQDGETETNVYVMEIDDEDTDGAKKVRKVRIVTDGKEMHKAGKVHDKRFIVRDVDGKLSEKELHELRIELKEGLAEMEIDLKEAMEEQRIAMLELESEGKHMVRVDTDCKDGKPGEWTDKKGNKVVKICKSFVMASALGGLKEARASIAADSEMPAETKAEVLRTLEEKIAEWHEKGEKGAKGTKGQK